MVDSLKYQRDVQCQLRKCLLPECHSATLCPVVGWYLCSTGDNCSDISWKDGSSSRVEWCQGGRRIEGGVARSC